MMVRRVGKCLVIILLRTFPKIYLSFGGECAWRFLRPNTMVFCFVHDPATVPVPPRAGSCQSLGYGRCYGVRHHRI